MLQFINFYILCLQFCLEISNIFIRYGKKNFKSQNTTSRQPNAYNLNA